VVFLFEPKAMKAWYQKVHLHGLFCYETKALKGDLKGAKKTFSMRTDTTD
jgi:hypothetical protein